MSIVIVSEQNVKKHINYIDFFFLILTLLLHMDALHFDWGQLIAGRTKVLVLVSLILVDKGS